MCNPDPFSAAGKAEEARRDAEQRRARKAMIDKPAKDLAEKHALQRQLADVRAKLAEATTLLSSLKAEEDQIVTTLKKRGWEEIEVEAGGAVAGALIGLGLEAL